MHCFLICNHYFESVFRQKHKIFNIISRGRAALSGKPDGFRSTRLSIYPVRYKCSYLFFSCQSMAFLIRLCFASKVKIGNNIPNFMALTGFINLFKA